MGRENEKEVCSLGGVDIFYLIMIPIERQRGNIGGQERVCVSEGSENILLARPVMCVISTFLSTERREDAHVCVE